MPRLPPVEKLPHARPRARFWPGVGYSVVTFAQSQSSSSATSWARPVSVPWPISERAMRITTVSSGCTTTQALISGVPAAALAVPRGTWKPSARPPRPAAEPTRNARRETSSAVVMIPLLWRGSALANVHALRGELDGGAHPVVGAAAADVGDPGIDVVVGGRRVVLQERGGGHDHAGLAVAALGHVELGPGPLHRVRAVGREALDRDDLLLRCY